MPAIRMSEAVAEYLAFRRAHGDKDNTIQNHAQVLRKATQAWGDIQVTSVTGGHISRLFSRNEWAPSTRNLYLGNLRAFFAWARSMRYYPRDADPTESWSSVRVPDTEYLRLDVHQFGEVLDAAPHPRDRAIIALGLFTLSRGSEVSNFRLSDLNLGDGTLRIYRIKTGDIDTLPVSSELAVEMNRYLNWYRQDQGILRQDWWLVPAKHPDVWVQGPNRRLVRSTRAASVKPTVQETKPYRAVQRALGALGYDRKQVGLHTLRRSGARALADRLRTEGYDSALLRVGSLMGHRDTKMTERYIGWHLERTQRNAMLTGQVMYPEMGAEAATLHVVEDNRG